MISPGLIPSAWYSAEVVASQVDGTILELELHLSSRRYFRRHVKASLDLSRRTSVDVVLSRIFSATGTGPSRHSAALHGRAFSARLAVERGRNIVVDAKSLTRGGR